MGTNAHLSGTLSLPSEVEVKNDTGSPLPVTGAVTANQANYSAASVATVVASVSSVTLLASNADRREFFIHNDSTSVLRIKYGTAASSTSFTALLSAGGSFNASAPVYTGIITGIWESATGNARITEVTP